MGVLDDVDAAAAGRPLVEGVVDVDPRVGMPLQIEQRRVNLGKQIPFRVRVGCPTAHRQEDQQPQSEYQAELCCPRKRGQPVGSFSRRNGPYEIK